MEVFMKKTICVFLVVCFFIAATSNPARADGFSVGAALLGGFLIGTIWAPRVITAPPAQFAPQPTTVCAQDAHGNVNCRTIQY